MGKSRYKVYEPTHPHFITCTILQFSFKERLNWIYSDYYEVGNNVTVVEKNEAGKAEVLFNSSNELLSICLSEDNRLKYLKIGNLTDGTVCKFINDTSIELHVVEHKHTITTKNWEKVKLQFKGGIQNSYGLSGILNKSGSKVVFYTAFKEFQHIKIPLDSDGKGTYNL